MDFHLPPPLGVGANLTPNTNHGSPAESLRIVSVNVARPGVLLEAPGVSILSSIDKRPVTVPSLRLSQNNLEGDEQADTRLTPSGQPVHGGEHQAVYVYPLEHYSRLQEILGESLWHGYMGENVTTTGATESDVCIGDTWQWGDARLQVTSPRGPCYKLGIRMGKQAARTVIRREGLVGWYLRVLRPGTVPTTGEMRLEIRDPQRFSVEQVHAALQDRGSTFPDLAAHPALSPNLRRALTTAGRDLSGGVPEED